MRPNFDRTQGSRGFVPSGAASGGALCLKPGGPNFD
jgi:hypothetical protein